ncbi:MULTISPECIES: enoyl-CoA hydratase/isomerase family protein [unclassified Chelatococcus]|uniref:enoyl-CoA hydratase/isomerase family protein n=1 Tax=unclassified Chelatococcus TaxID=2638111 RepID=UPI001BCFDAB1|nr:MULTISPECIES: enoyl-CoA hydratase/isomerase family protein [unclassified Chelatococcus]MBS7742653.1 enoyl-CoA hydratase/isomerase family protein [Chelatococcus sp. HY11]MBX3542229.1 enoyl-CoA hydratase/isomerase family protein [Chelatococcus sp.]MCO5075554.1 enoyl-CoA hydratase/isomerase family protein [Chelatococcus sp.]CAH1695342.1 Enoyl-CoA hydratase [Hyphomicrobiales bacterium]
MIDRYVRYSSLSIRRLDDAILRVSFDRPDRKNALSADMHREIADIWREIDADPEVRVVLLCGEGEHFSVGGEFDVVEAMIVDVEFRMRVWREARDLVYNMVNCSKPIVSALQGAVVGGGLAAGLLADISIAANNARLVDGHVRLGVCAGDHAVILWPLLCSMAKVKYHLLLNEPITGARAEQIGLVSLAVDEAVLEETALGVAKRLTDGSQTAIRLTKYALNNWLRTAGPAFDTSLALEMLGFSGDDAAEGLASFRERRSPNFTKDKSL